MNYCYTPSTAVLMANNVEITEILDIEWVQSNLSSFKFFNHPMSVVVTTFYEIFPKSSLF